MIINRISEENEKYGADVKEIDMSEDYDVQSSAQRDLVILYENVDPKQASVSINKKLRMPNQYVENVVYKDDQESEDSDSGDIYSNEDIYDVVLINKERIDLLNSVPSLEKTLCQKFGDFAISTGLAANYDRHSFSRRPFVKGQFKSLNDIPSRNLFDGALLSTCLLDFICSNQLDDTSNFYMDSIIQYAKRTIAQLKRISNGDYLTDRAKEQWKKMGDDYKHEEKKTCNAVMAKSHTFCVEGDKKMLRGLVRSELNMRTLSKVLENNLFVRIPRSIGGSWKLFGELCENDLIFECKKVKQAMNDEKKPAFDLVVQLAQSKSRKRGGIIPLLIIPQTLPCMENEPLLSLKYNNSNENTGNTIGTENSVTITELKECDFEGSGDNLVNRINCSLKSESSDTADTQSSIMCISDTSFQSSNPVSNFYSPKQHYDNNESITPTKASCAMIPDDLFRSIQQFNAQTVLLEENEEPPLIKKKSPTKIRIKSPYENKTLVLEERKRRKLLEIRERREKRKKALSENCKVKKHKYAKSAVTAQPSNSVTKLSITNKSFYASIYGDNANVINKHGKRHLPITEGCDGNGMREEAELSEGNKKFVNRSYYLDDHETEVRNLQIQNSSFNSDIKELSTPSSTDMSMGLNSFPQLGETSSTSFPQNTSCYSEKLDSALKPTTNLPNSSHTSTTRLINANTKKALTSLECKKSIDKIYELMKKLSAVDSDSSHSKCQSSRCNDVHYQTPEKSFTIQTSDSGTSVKHRMKSSNPSIYSFEDQIDTKSALGQNIATERSLPEANVVSKVTINNKSQMKSDDKEVKPLKKVTIKTPTNISRNPLKAISQLINEFDNIQKNRQKTAIDIKDKRKTSNVATDGKNVARQASFLKRGPRENPTREIKSDIKKVCTGTNDRKLLNSPKVNIGKVANFDKNFDREKKISDLIEDALREARGEAVKGPSKLNSRLESLAQPKRYVVNGQEELRLRHGRHSLLDRAPHSALRSSQISDKPLVSPVTGAKVSQKRMEPDRICSTKPSNLPTKDKLPMMRRIQNTLNSVDDSSPQYHSRLPKRIIPTDVSTKKRPLTLTQTSGSSNLLQKSKTSHDMPTKNFYLQPKESTWAISNPLKEISNTVNPFKEESSVPIQINTEFIGRSKRNSETKMESFAINEDELISISSDYAFDVLEDKNVLTAVESISANKENFKEKQKKLENNRQLAINSNTDIQQYNEFTEDIEDLEKALYKQLSQGVFQKRPKVKNLTLTPKQSLHKVLLLQCGDTNSLLVKSCLSQNLCMSNTKNIATPGVGYFPILSKSYMDWSLPRGPTNITTIGYSFPARSIECGSNTINIDAKNPLDNTDQLKNSSYERGVQTLLLDKDTDHDYLDTHVGTEIIQEKVNKFTEWDKTLIHNGNDNLVIENDIENENVDNTTSLDILTELMEEIENISKYQSFKAMDDEKEFDPLCLQKLSNNCYCHNSTNCCENNNVFSNSINIELKQEIKDIQPRKYADKEVAAYISKEHVNEFTDAPSQLWLPKERYENVSNTQILSQPSSHSLVSLYDYRALYSNKFKEITKTNVDFGQNGSLGRYKNCRQNLIKSNDDKMLFVDQNHFNAMLIMKRDILVTVYSILVFTVFAALSFPEFLYNF